MDLLHSFWTIRPYPKVMALFKVSTVKFLQEICIGGFSTCPVTFVRFLKRHATTLKSRRMNTVGLTMGSDLFPKE